MMMPKDEGRHTVPRPESDHETKPGEEESATIGGGDGIKEGNGAGLLIDRVYFWRTPEFCEGIHLASPASSRVCL